MDIILEAYRSPTDPKRFGRVNMFEHENVTDTYQYLLNKEQQLLMKITIVAGQGIYWDVNDDKFFKRMQQAHADRSEKRFEFTHALYGEAKLVQNYMFKKLDQDDDDVLNYGVLAYSVCFILDDGCLRCSSVSDAGLEDYVTVEQLRELGY